MTKVTKIATVSQTPPRKPSKTKNGDREGRVKLPPPPPTTKISVIAPK